MAMALNSMPLKSVVVLITVRTADRAVWFAHKLNRALPPRFAIPFCPPQQSARPRSLFRIYPLAHGGIVAAFDLSLHFSPTVTFRFHTSPSPRFSPPGRFFALSLSAV